MTDGPFVSRNHRGSLPVTLQCTIIHCYVGPDGKNIQINGAALFISPIKFKNLSFKVKLSLKIYHSK